MEDEIFKISKNPIRAKSLFEMAQERFADIKRETKTYKIIEEYYEIIKELLTALMYSSGFKTLSHKMLVYFLKENYKEFSIKEIEVVDRLRRLRNDIVYYGQKVERDFLVNNEDEIIKIIKKLFAIVKNV